MRGRAREPEKGGRRDGGGGRHSRLPAARTPAPPPSRPPSLPPSSSTLDAFARTCAPGSVEARDDAAAAAAAAKALATLGPGRSSAAAAAAGLPLASRLSDAALAALRQEVCDYVHMHFKLSQRARVCVSIGNVQHSAS